ncbi:uncharacterized protein LOC113519043 isoform X2 [Galleria mellonella]|uniref:Uncharacterized protein LOC113519043 isoform X2 n=1 Tax=Galleria mellonella TaxID=7137 RepID=A0ABM3MBQ4_GALME|nr:uncharacterized protein LOC113519043 isoform X2 [Galleria mellonella]
MRKAFISILAVLAFAQIRGSDVGKDGFNFYKDYLRARSDEAMLEPGSEERTLYFYRTPLQLYPGLLPVLDQEYRKRTGNAFKNHMLSKELRAEDVPGKRSSKTALSLMLQGKQHPYYEKMGHYCPYGK